MNEKKMTLEIKQCSKHLDKKIIFFYLSQDYYELPKRTVRANGGMYHIFKPNSYRDKQHHFQYKISMYMSLQEFKNQLAIGWEQKYQPFIFDMTKDNYTGSYRLGLISIFIPNSSPF